MLEYGVGGPGFDDNQRDEAASNAPAPTMVAPTSDAYVAKVIATGDEKQVAALIAERPTMATQIHMALQSQRGIQFSRQVYAAGQTMSSPDEAPAKDDDDEVVADKPRTSHRFDAGTPIVVNVPLMKGDRGPRIRKLQQALFDLRYRPISVSGVFDDETEAHIKDLQARHKLNRHDGVVDQATFDAVNSEFSSMKIYAEDAMESAPGMHDTPRRQSGPPPTPLMRETHIVGPEEKQQEHEALVPDPGTFVDPSDHGTYAQEIEKELVSQITEDYEHATKVKSGRSDSPMFDMQDIARVGNAARSQVQHVFGSFASGDKLVVGKNLFDRYDKDTSTHDSLTDKGKLKAAKSRLFKIVNTEPVFRAIDERHHASRGRDHEKGIIEPIVDKLATAHRDQLLLITATWGGHTDKDGAITMEPGFKGATDDQDREILWGKFGTLVHEICHSLSHGGWKTFRSARADEDPTAGQVLQEGITEFLTRTVLATVDTESVALRHSVEGFEYDANFKPNLQRDSYQGLFEKAEAWVGVVGINNLYAAYFLGQTQLVGAGKDP